MANNIVLTRNKPIKAGKYLHSRNGESLEVVSVNDNLVYPSGSDMHGIPYFCSADRGFWLCIDDIDVQFEEE